VACRLSIPFLDLLPAVADDPHPQQLWVNATDAHPNGATNERYARRIDEWLERTILAR
jgi:hypothetical protein